MPVLSLLKVQIPSTLSTLSKKWRLLSCGVLHPKIFMSFNDLLNPEEEVYVVDHATDKGIFDAAINILLRTYQHLIPQMMMRGSRNH